MRFMGRNTYGATGVNYTIWMLQISPRNSAIICRPEHRLCSDEPGGFRVCGRHGQGAIIGE